MLRSARTPRFVSCSLLAAALAACSSPTDHPQADSAAAPAAGGDKKPAAAPQQTPAQAAHTQELIQQKQQLLIKTSLDNAKALQEQGKYEEARDQLAQVIQLDPSNTQALTSYAEIQQLLGERSGDIETTRQAVERRNQARSSAMKLEAEEYYRLGNEAVARGEYDVAIRDFERVAQSIKWSTLGVDWGDLEKRNDAALVAAKRARDDAATSDREAKLREAVKQVQNDETQERSREMERIKSLLESANLKYEKGDYEGSVQLCDEVLRLEPGNLVARDLRKEANDARRTARSADFEKHRKEQFRRFKSDIEELRIPYADGLTPPDDAYWAKVIQRKPAGSTGTEDAATLDNRRLRDQIKSIRIPVVNFQDSELKDVCTVLTNLSGITIVPSPKALTELESGGTLITLSNLTNLSLDAILNIVTKQLGEGKYAWTVKNGVVQITTLVDAYGDAQIKTHSVQDLTFGRTDFKGPKIAGIPLPNKYGDSPEDSVFAADLEKTVTITVEDIISLIKENVAKETWELGDKKFSIDKAGADQILVVHTAEVQAQIDEFLNDLRRFTSTVVQLESRFVEITDAFLQEVGTDWRGLGGAAGSAVNLDDVTAGPEDNASQGLDNLGTGSTGTASPSAGAFFNDGSKYDLKARTENFSDQALGSILSSTGGGAFQFAILKHNQFNLVVHAIEKSVNATEVMAPELTVFNTERAYVSVINEVSFLQDFDVDVANTAFIANPTIGVLQEGVVLDVRPTISYDRKFVTLDVRASVAKLARPIPTFTTTLGGFSTAVTFQLPSLQVQNANTTVIVPDGGSVILGGLKTVNYQNQKAEVPWLAKIPVVGILFRDKGVDDESKSLVILVKANIRDLSKYREAAPVR
jgi:type II secretory pathway component GspD/PulD (secretin)/tetratricopeptide (TPR) repeat protein